MLTEMMRGENHGWVFFTAGFLLMLKSFFNSRDSSGVIDLVTIVLSFYSFSHQIL